MPPRLFVEVTEPNRPTFKVELARRLTFGRLRGNKCRLRHLSVSRLHAVILSVGERWLVSNLASGNPIRIRAGMGPTRQLDENEEVEVADEYVFELGKVRCRVTRDSADVRTAPTRGIPSASVAIEGPTVLFELAAKETAGAERSEAPTKSSGTVEALPVAPGTMRADPPTQARDSASSTGKAPLETVVQEVTGEGRVPGGGSQGSPEAPPAPRQETAEADHEVGSAAAKESLASPDLLAVAEPSEVTPTRTVDYGDDAVAPRGTTLADIRAANPRLVIIKEGIEAIATLAPYFTAFEDGELVCTVGRGKPSPSAKACLIADDSVSSLHAQIVTRDRRFFVIDRESRNETRILGRKTDDTYVLERRAEALIPGKPELLTPDTHLRFGLVDVLFIADVNEDECRVDTERYCRALLYLERQRHLTRRQRHAILAKSRREREPNVGAILLRDGVLPIVRWLNALKFGELVLPEPSFWGWWARLWSW